MNSHLNKYDAFFKPITVQSMTDLLLTDCNTSKSSFIIRINWVYKFIQCYNIFKICFSQKYDHQQTLCENSNKIQKWFKLVWNIIKEWKIINENIYNFDETGFIINIIAITKVITQINKCTYSNLV